MHPGFVVTHRFLGMSYLGKGMYDQAIAEFRKGLELSGDNPANLARLGHAYALAGKRREALNILRQLEELSKERYVAPSVVATVHAGLGHNDLTFAWLEKAFEERANAMAWLGARPNWDRLRSDPRFQSLLRRVGLPQADGT
jgi:tetratricopeptide (TPR) repeat protein